MKTVGCNTLLKKTDGCGISESDQLNEPITSELSQQNSSECFLRFFIKNDQERKGSFKWIIRQKIKLIVVTILLLISFNNKSYSCYFLSAYQSSMTVCASNPATTLYTYTSNLSSCCSSWTANSVTFYYSTDFTTWIYLGNVSGTGAASCNLPTLSSYSGEVYVKAVMGGTFVINYVTYYEIEDRLTYHYQSSASTGPTLTQSSSSVCTNNDITYTISTTNVNSYTWTILGTLGADYTITSGNTGSQSITLKWLTAGSKTVKGKFSNACGSSPDGSITTTVNASPTPSFTASPSSTVSAYTSVTYTTQSGQNNYAWTVPGTPGTDYTIISGGVSSTDNTVTLQWLTTGSKTVTVNYENAGGCSGAIAATNAITVNVQPPVISYITPNIYTKGTLITALTPTNTGGPITGYSVSPGLPAGLSLNPTTGAISGTPTSIVATATYAVTATNAGGNGTFGISITVNDVAPSSLSYASSPISATYGVAITNASPTASGGSVVSYSIFPALPAGLSLNTSTGAISGTPTTISGQTDYTVTATNSGGSTTATVKITVNKKELTVVNAVTSNKVYDGTTTASVTGGTLNGIVLSDAITLTQAGTFASKNVGTSIAITSACSITGTNAGNYTLTQPTLTPRNITAKALTVSGATTTNKVYDGNATASVSGGTLVGIVSPDVVTLTQAGTFASKNVGTSIAITSACSIGGADVANYTLTQPTLTARDITAKALTITGATTSDKVYDGNATASVSGGSIVGVISPDVVNLTQSGTFASKNVGTSIAITSACSISGTDATNYTLTQPTLTPRNITAKALTVSGATTTNKVYDGTTTASVSGGTLVGIVSPDVVTLTQAGTFASKNVGTSIAITSACSISGTDAANYTLTQPTLTAQDITAKALTVSGATTTNKVYDGTTTASVSGGTLVGIVSPDLVTLTQAGTFASKNVGTSIAITSACSISGTDVSNYTLTQPTLTARNITAKALSITGATTSDKVYDGNTTASVTGGTLVGIVSPDVVTLTQSGTFVNKNVGVSKAITSTSTLGGTDAANYSLTQPTLTARNITAKSISVTGATTSDKVYDGNTTASVSGGTLNGTVGGDAVTLTQAGTFASKNVGTSIAITSGCSIFGTDAANYTLIQPTLTARNITVRSLVVTASGINKVYDGNTTATVTLSDNRVSGDSFTTNYTTANFTDKEKGTGKTVSVSGISISGTDAANYTFNTTASTTASITAKALTVSAAGIDKVYDQNTTAIVTLGDNRVPGDVLTSTYTTATFNDKNVGTAKTVSVSGISISGTDAGNYTFNSSATTTATITAKTLAVTTTATNKVYDATTAATTTLADDRISGDVLTLAKTSSVFDDKNVGTGKLVTVSGISKSGTDAGNYVLGNVTATTTANITQKALTISATGINKQYDGNATASVTLGDNRVSGDVLISSYTTATFPDKLIGTGKTVSVSGISISGTDAANYSYSTTASTTANITAKALTITATGINKGYDQNTTATVSLSDNRVSGDVLTSTYTSATFNNKNVGTGKQVSVSGISISGTDIGNYTFNATALTVADITAKPLNVTATAANKVYDGSTTATVTLADDRISGDVLTSTYTAADFSDKNVDTEKEVAVTGISISGTDALNYSVNESTTATADITYKILTISGSNGDKVYDGTVNTTATLTDNRVSGDDLNITYATAKFPDKNVGTAKKVTVSGISMSGADVQNYMTNNTVKFNANITQRPVTVTGITASDKVYDATTMASLSGGTLSNVVSGDDVTVSAGTGAFADKNAGNNKAIVTAGYSIGGTNVANYILAEQPSTVTANISQKAATIEGVSATNKVYDGTTVATLTGGTVSGVISGDVVTIVTGTGAFADQYKGTNKSVTASGYSLSGTDGANYALTAQPLVTNADITGILVTITGVTASDKTYDGTDVATLNGGTLVGVLPGDDVTIVAGTGAFNDKNAGSGKTVTATGYSLGGTLAANYTLASQPTVTNAEITKAPLTITGVIASNKVYNATTAATLNGGILNGIIGSDDVTITAGTGSFADKTVGTGKAVTAVGYGLSGTDAPNYTLTAQPSEITADISQAELTISGVTANDKAYDATVTASLTAGTLNGIISGDVVNLVAGTGSFADKNVGTSKVVTASGFSLSGTDGANYILAAQPSGLSADITPASTALTITGVTASDKTYDGTTVATLSGGTLSGVISGDVVNITAGTGAFADKTIGTGKSVTATGYSLSGTDAGNYTLAAQPTIPNADITAASLTLTGVTASNKVYDATTAATLSGGVLNGIAGTDDVTIVAGTGSFTNKNAGAAKVVTATGYGIDGADAGNYTLSGQPSGLTADITTVSVTITGVIASNKVYDTNSVATLSGGTLSGVITGDVVTITDGTGAFADKKVGTAKPVTATGYTLAGTDASNYTLSAQPTGMSADITAVTLDITGVTASNKVYDGTTAATMNTGSLSGILSSDDVTLTAGTASFADKTVGTAKPVIASGFSLSGADAGNYTLSGQPSGLTANITKAPVDITGLTASNKVYDATTAATLSGGVLNGIAGTDDVTIVAGTGSFANKNAGTAKVVTATGYGIDGADAGNYTFSGQPSGLTADITTAPVEITGVTASSKGYNANSVATLSGGTLSGVITGDVVTITDGTGAFTDKNVGTAKVVSATNYGITGADAGNYTLLVQPTGMSANITPAPLSITAQDKSKTYGSPNPEFTLNYGGLVGGETTNEVTNLKITCNADVSSKVGKYNISLSGGNASNYEISLVDGVLEITKAVLTVTAENKIRVVGSTNPEFTLTYLGFKNNENTSAIAELPTATTAASEASPAGEYSIIASGGLSDNYTFNFINGKLLITSVAGDTNGDGKITAPEIAGDTNGDGKITAPEIAGDMNGDGKITDPEVAGDTNGDGKITDPEIAGDTNGDGQITAPEIAGDTNGDGKITAPEIAGDTNGDGKITAPEIAGDTNGDGKITAPEVLGDTNGDGKIGNGETAGDANGDGKINNGETAGNTGGNGSGIAGDTNGDGKITAPEIAGDTNGDGKITAPEIAGDTNGDGKITDPEIAGDTNSDGKITAPEIAGDTNGDGKITAPEVLGDTNGDGKITAPEIAGDTNGDGKITDPEVAGDTNGDGKITAPELLGDTNGDGKIGNGETAGDANGDGKIANGETAGNTGGNGSGIAGDTNGDGKITDPEIAGDTNGDGKITAPEVLGDTNGDGKIGNGETAGDANGDGKIDNGETAGNTGGNGSGIAGDTNGDGKITAPEIAGDTNGDGKITAPEVAGDTNGDGKITAPEVLGDTNGDGKIGNGETAGDANGDGKIDNGETAGNTGGNGSGIAGDTNGDGKITAPEIAGDTNGDGKITSPEVAGDTNGDGKITAPEILGDTNGDGKITFPETAGDINGDGKITAPEIAGDTNGDGKITAPEILGDVNGDGKIDGDEIAGDKNGNGVIDPTETRVIDPDKDHLNVDHLFSPNGDGINDYWKLPEIEQLGRVYVKIYDRWGNLVYESISYQNDWDGTSKGKPVPEGGYIYFIKTEKAGNKTGVINIIR